MAIPIRKYSRGRKFGDFDPTSDIISKHPQLGTRQVGDYYKATASGTASSFDVTKLAGYGVTATATGDSNTGITSVLSPMKDNIGNNILIVVGPSYHSKTNGLGITATTAESNGDLTGKVVFISAEPSPLPWGTDISDYANVSTGFYWISFPSSSGTTIKFWYDRQKWFDAFGGAIKSVYFDQAGCVWDGDPEAGGTFVCGPTFEDAYGSVFARNNSADNLNSTNQIVPVAAQFGGFRLDNAVLWYSNSTPSQFLTLLGNGDFGGKYHSVNVNVKLDTNGQGAFYNFLNIPSGLYEWELPYDTQLNGTRIPFYYDKAKWENAFSGLNPTTDANRIHIDPLGNVWKGALGVNGGTFVCGPQGEIESISVNTDETFMFVPEDWDTIGNMGVGAGWSDSPFIIA